MKIFDCFIFNHEVELLEIRLNILNDYVDKFVITEGDMTISGLPKESHFLNNKERFPKWEDKVKKEAEALGIMDKTKYNSVTNKECYNVLDCILFSSLFRYIFACKIL